MSLVNDALSLSTRHRLYRLRTRTVSAGLSLARKLAIVAIGGAVGWVSACYMVETGTRLPTLLPWRATASRSSGWPTTAWRASAPVSTTFPPRRGALFQL